MKQKHVDASREARLWLGQVFIPAAIVVGSVLSNKDAKNYVSNKFNSAKNFVKEKVGSK